MDTSNRCIPHYNMESNKTDKRTKLTPSGVAATGTRSSGSLIRKKNDPVYHSVERYSVENSKWDTSIRGLLLRRQTESDIRQRRLNSTRSSRQSTRPRTSASVANLNSSFSKLLASQKRLNSQHSTNTGRWRQYGSSAGNTIASRRTTSDSVTLGERHPSAAASPDESDRQRISISGNPALEKFQQAGRHILTLIKATKYTSHQRDDPKLLSFTQYKNDILGSKLSNYGEGLQFDPMEYRSPKQSPLSDEAKSILSMDPADRTSEQLHTALLAVQTAVEAFSEFPINMQNSLVRVGWYEQFNSKRVIIRQGHTADNFYFIVSGTAVVTHLETSKKTGEAYSRTLALLGAGNSFGELALMHASKRSATVTVQDEVGLLAVSRDDFVNIFMHAEKDKDPEHILYLKSLDIIRGWPVDVLPRTDPNICLFTYFRRGTVMVQDSNNCDWLYFIKSGSCRVLKSLRIPDPIDEDKTHQRHVDIGQLTPKPATKSAPVKKHVKMSQGSAPAASAHRPGTLCGLKGPPHDAGEQRLMQEHQRQLDAVYKVKHDETWKNDQLMEAKRKKQNSKRMFVEIQQLGVHDTFGLDHVAFSMLGNCPSVSLVSDGAEAVLINKRFFLQHLTDEMARTLRTTIRPFPDEASLQQKLRRKTMWDAFKHSTVSDHVSFSRLLRQTNSMYF